MEGDQKLNIRFYEERELKLFLRFIEGNSKMESKETDMIEARIPLPEDLEFPKIQQRTRRSNALQQ